MALRPLLALAVPWAALAAAGCGGNGGADAAAAPRPPVRLLLTTPDDAVTTAAPTVSVRGTVSPRRARVLVLGRRVAVQGGRFAATVPLREGANVIDVGASAPGATATWHALRVTRRSKVAVPDVVGLTIDNATARLKDRGLRASYVDDEGFFDAFRSGPRRVCSTSPDASSEVDPRSEVQLTVSKSCR